MRTSLKVLTAATALVVVMAGSPVLYAHGSEDAAGSAAPQMGQGGMMGQDNMPTGQGGMMGQGGMTGQDNMPGNMAMGQGGMMNMMNMMGQMGQTMDTHSKFMNSMLEAHDIQPDDEQQ